MSTLANFLVYNAIPPGCDYFTRSRFATLMWTGLIFAVITALYFLLNLAGVAHNFRGSPYQTAEAIYFFSTATMAYLGVRLRIVTNMSTPVFMGPFVLWFFGVSWLSYRVKGELHSDTLGMLLLIVFVNNDVPKAGLILFCVIHALMVIFFSICSTHPECFVIDEPSPTTGSIVAWRIVADAALGVLAITNLRTAIELLTAKLANNKDLIEVGERIARCIAVYDVEGIEEVLEDYYESLEEHLLHTYQQIADNLSRYKSFLPAGLFSEGDEFMAEEDDESPEKVDGMLNVAEENPPSSNNPLRGTTPISASGDEPAAGMPMETLSLDDTRRESSLMSDSLMSGGASVSVLKVSGRDREGSTASSGSPSNHSASAVNTFFTNKEFFRKVDAVIALMQVGHLQPTDNLWHTVEDGYKLVHDAVKKHDGEVMDVIGDSIMAAWNVTKSRRGAVNLALRCALEIQSDMEAESMLGVERPFSCAIIKGTALFGTVGSKKLKRFMLIAPWMKRLRLLDEAARFHKIVAVNTELNNTLAGLFTARCVDYVRRQDEDTGHFIHEILSEHTQGNQEWMYNVQNEGMNICDIISKSLYKFCTGQYDEGNSLLNLLPPERRADPIVTAMEAHAIRCNSRGIQYARCLGWGLPEKGPAAHSGLALGNTSATSSVGSRSGTPIRTPRQRTHSASVKSQ